ncbi:phage tail terminator protein [Vreelandella sp. EE7]
MSTEPDYDVIDEVIDRVREQCPGMATVDNAPFAEPIDNFDMQTPAALPWFAEDVATGDAETNRPIQQVRLTYGVWLVCKRHEFKAQRRALRKALMGHGFSRMHNPMQYRGGQTVDIRGELIWWREYWTTDTWIHG